MVGRTVTGRKLAGRRKLEEESGKEEVPNCGSFGRSSVTVAPVRRRFSGTREGPALRLWRGGRAGALGLEHGVGT